MKRRLVILLAATLALLGREARAGETSLGIDVGYVKPKRIEATLFFNGNFRFHLSRRFALEPEFSYWRKSSSALAVTASLEDLQFGANLLAVVPVGRTVEVFGGGGGGLHQITGNLAAGGNNAVSDSIRLMIKSAVFSGAPKSFSVPVRSTIASSIETACTSGE